MRRSARFVFKMMSKSESCLTVRSKDVRVEKIELKLERVLQADARRVRIKK